MFFGRFGQKSSVESVSQSAKNKKRRHRIAMLSLAVAVSMPVGVVELAKLYAQDVQPESSGDLLKQGQQQLASDQYEEALQTLHKIDRDNLSTADQKTLDNALSNAERGAEGRRSARADYQAGETALASGQTAYAISHYRAAASNRYADKGTHEKALEKIALAEAEQKKDASADAQLYKQAVREYKAGQLADSQQKFEELESHGYHAPLFQDSPSHYLDEISRRGGAALTAKPKQQSPANTETAQKPEEAPKAPEAPTAPEAPVPAPTASAEAMSDQSQPAAPAPSANADANSENNNSEQQAESKPALSAKQAYDRGRHEYRTGDWIAARRDLTIAKDKNYHPGLFEESPTSILAKMDKKENADRQREMTQAERKRHDEEVARQAEETRRQEEQAKRQQEEQARQQQEQQNSNASANANESSQQNASPTNTQETPAPAPVANAAPTEQNAPEIPAKAPAENNAESTEVAQSQNSQASPSTEAPANQTEAQNPPPVVQPTNQTAASNNNNSAQQALQDTAKLEQIRQQARAYEASQLVDQARKAQNENRLADALRLYTRAADLDPNNQAAVAGRAQIQILTGRTPQPSPLMQQQQQIIDERRQSIQYTFKSAIQNANDAIAAHNFQVAETDLATARAARDQDPTIFTPEEMRTFNSTIESTQLTLNRTRDQVAIEERARAQQEAEQQQRTQAEQATISRQNTVKDLIAAAQHAIQEGKYDEAVNILNQILTLDPNNDYALGVKPLVEDKVIILQQRSYREQFQHHLLGQLNAAEEKKIPYDDIFRYPDNWPDISAERDQEVAESQGIDPEDRAVDALLDRKIPEVHFEAIPFSDVIDFFRDVTGANIFVNWTAIEALAIDKTTPVSVGQLKNVTFRTALTAVLTSVGGANAKLGYKVDNGVITISTADALKGATVARVYDIQDLLVQHEEFQNVPFINISNQQAATSGGGNIQSPIQSTGQPNPQDIQQQRDKMTQFILDSIRSSITDNSWADTGGTGTITAIPGQGQLIVAQTPDNQRVISHLLALMRENQGIQVNIEARFLTVQRNFLDQVGLNLNFGFAGSNPAQTQTVGGVVQHVPGTGVFGPVTMTTAVGNQPFNFANTGAPGTLNSLTVPPSGTTLSAAYLSDLQVNLILQATQANENTTLVTAPRVTVFNGQEAYILVQTQEAYVGNLTAVTAAGVAAFQPQPSIIPTGAILDVTPTVSPDRKYVTMALHPQISSLEQLTTFPFQTGVASQGGGLGGGGATPSANIQLPTVAVTDLHTIVSVPDGGTLLLGGQTIAGEDVREQGTPILSKIPFLKRLFTNKSTAKDEQILLILVKPTILIQREQEGNQFPLLSQKVAP